MRKIVRRITMLVLAAAFLVSAGTVVFVKRQYRASEALYQAASSQFTARAGSAPLAYRVTERPQAGEPASVLPPEETAEAESVPEEEAEAGETEKKRNKPVEYAPLRVDFEKLQEINPEVVGWIYCEDTVIDYPILQAADNDYYLHRGYDREYNICGSIFAEAQNLPDFADLNTILYGHHMSDGSMFASLELWGRQEYYEEHPVMWILTPEQDYKLILFSGYTTSAFSDSYVVHHEADEDWEVWLKQAIERSDFQADIDLEELAELEELEDGGHTVMLSTCAYVCYFARYVIHGVLVPVEGKMELSIITQP